MSHFNKTGFGGPKVGGPAQRALGPARPVFFSRNFSARPAGGPARAHLYIEYIISLIVVRLEWEPVYLCQNFVYFI